MATKKKTAGRARARRSPGRRTATGLAISWEGTRAALGSAEAAMQRRMRSLVKQGHARREQASEALAGWRSRLLRERRKAMKQLDAQLALLQTRARRERRALSRLAEEAVRNALAALNIPSRQEVHELTRRVEELSRRIDGFRRATPRRATPRRAPAARVHPTAQA